MNTENLYIPQQDEIEVTELELEAIDYSDFPVYFGEVFDLNFED